MKELYDPPKSPVTWVMRTAPRYEIDVLRSDPNEDWVTEHTCTSFKQALTQCARLELKIDIEAVSLWARYPEGDPIEIPNSAWLDPESPVRWPPGSIESEAKSYGWPVGPHYALYDPWSIEMRLAHLGLPTTEPELWQWVVDQANAGILTADQDSGGGLISCQRPPICKTRILKDGQLYGHASSSWFVSLANAVWWMVNQVHGRAYP